MNVYMLIKRNISAGEKGELPKGGTRGGWSRARGR